jgi:hypothetical protein
MPQDMPEGIEKYQIECRQTEQKECQKEYQKMTDGRIESLTTCWMGVERRFSRC